MASRAWYDRPQAPWLSYTDTPMFDLAARVRSDLLVAAAHYVLSQVIRPPVSRTRFGHDRINGG